jgi:hypothetical protein
MRKAFGIPLLSILVLATAVTAAAPQAPNAQRKESGMETGVTKIKEAMLGEWMSIAPEVRPSASKKADGHLSHSTSSAFKYLPSDRFELESSTRRTPTAVPPPGSR